jgi:hypothetical protein
LAFLAPQTWARRARFALIAGICLVAVCALILTPRTPLGLGYHDFADRRTMVGVPNALDVLSNIPFFIVGAWGLLWLIGKSSRSSFLDARERVPYLIFFAGVMLTGIGSFWYHMSPSDGRLPWDLLPMTLSFISMVVSAFMERVSLRGGLLLLGPMLLVGMSTVVYWYISSSLGYGDYKYYLFVQFFSPVVLALIIGLFPPRYTGMTYLVVAFGFFVAAKIFEVYDYSIYRHLGHAVSGHSLKHVTAAVACYWILKMLWHRCPVQTSDSPNSPWAKKTMSLFQN